MLYSVGYEGRTARQLVDNLSLVGVAVLVDVRLTPISRKPGLSKTALSAALVAAGIDYMHEPLLGNPPDNRDAFRKGDVAVGRQRFSERLRNGAGEVLRELVVLAAERQVAVLCVERDAERCHRQVITDHAAELDPSLIVVTL